MVNRITPNLPTEAYLTYAIHSPADRTIPAACPQVGCVAHARGWETSVDETTALGAQQAAYIRTRSGRTFREARSGTLTVFRFDSGQRCFAEHFTRPEIYAVRRGDWRGNLGGVRQHATAADWVDDFGSHQQVLADAMERG